jgi:hypothetical protein
MSAEQLAEFERQFREALEALIEAARHADDE